MLREMEALDLFAQGRHGDAFAALDRAAALQARMPKPIGRPFPVKDVYELYGELLLQVNRAKEAITWFDRIAGANAESQPRVVWIGAGVSQCRRCVERTRRLQEIPDELSTRRSRSSRSCGSARSSPLDLVDLDLPDVVARLQPALRHRLVGNFQGDVVRPWRGRFPAVLPERPHRVRFRSGAD